jgi:hypothetical protein
MKRAECRMKKEGTVDYRIPSGLGTDITRAAGAQDAGGRQGRHSYQPRGNAPSWYESGLRPESSAPDSADHLWVAKTSSTHEIVNLQRLAAERLPPVLRAWAQSNAVRATIARHRCRNTAFSMYLCKMRPTPKRVSLWHSTWSAVCGLSRRAANAKPAINASGEPDALAKDRLR